MMIFFLNFLNLLLLANTAVKKPIYYSIQITITESSQYCGGAAPPAELVEELAKPKPSQGHKIIIKSGSINNSKSRIVKEIITDSLGQCNVKLPAGTYFIVEENKKDKTYYNQLLKDHKNATQNHAAVDKACLDKWYAQPDLTFIVSSKAKKKIEHNYFTPCNWGGKPCVIYNGPMPP